MAGPNGAREGFDANARAARRESGPITIGDSTYHPARLTNKRLREVRSLARRAGIEAKAAAHESQEYADAYAEAIAEGKDEKEATELAEEAGNGSETVSEINIASLQTQLPILLRDGDMQPPSEETIARHLDDDLDARDVEGLMSYLLGPEDPTPTPTEGTITS